MPSKQSKKKAPPVDPTNPARLRSMAENEALIELVSEMMAMRRKRWEIKAAINAALGYDLGPATLDKVIQAAQRIQIQNFKRDRDIHLGEAQAFYENAIREAPDWRDKLAAQGGLNAIHGLEFNPKEDKSKMSEEERQEMYRQLIEGLKSSTENTTDSVVKPEDE